MPPPGGCLTPRQVKNILLGQASADEADALEAHLDGCPACQTLLDGLHVNSQITDALRAGPGSGVGRPAPDLDDLMGRLEQLGSRWSVTTGPALGRTERPTLAPAEAGDEIGRLGRYRVLEVLGEGGMGVVYRAEDPALRRLVALKVLRPAFARRPEARRRFLHEAAAMAAVKHDHIATVFEVGEADVPGAAGPVPFLAMELLDGESLLDRLRAGPLPPAVAARVGAQAAAGLAAAHARGLVHRDLKPGNLWLETPPGWADEPPADRLPLGAAGRLKLLDFGLATPPDEAAGEVVGTPAYMAPEQVRGDPLDARCDLFALGCVLYEMCVGSPPYRRTRAELVTRTPDLTPAPSVLAVPPPLAGLIARLLSADPAGRPASAREVARELAEIERAASTPRRPGRMAGVAALGLAAVAAAAWAVGGRPAEVAVPVLATEADGLPPGPADDAWCRAVAGLPPERQAKAVLAKLREVNPGFDGSYERLNVGDGRVIELRFYSDHVTDIGPVRALTRLSSLGCTGSKPGAGRLTDLSPIRTLRLEWLFVSRNPDLTDLGPLRGMTLNQLESADTRVFDLDPLDGSRLFSLSLTNTQVRDLSPVRRMPVLRSLSVAGTAVDDLGPLAGSPLQQLWLPPSAARDEAALKRMPALQAVNGRPVADALRAKPPTAPTRPNP
jgi:hypothetical protein